VYSAGSVFKGEPHFLKLNIKCSQDVFNVSANISPRVGIFRNCHSHTSTVRNSGKGEQVDFSGNEAAWEKKRQKVKLKSPVLTENISRVIMADPMLVSLGNQIT